MIFLNQIFAKELIPSIYISTYLYLSRYLFIYLDIHLSVCLWIDMEGERAKERENSQTPQKETTNQIKRQARYRDGK